jgi:hypothetical protein
LVASSSADSISSGLDATSAKKETLANIETVRNQVGRVWRLHGEHREQILESLSTLEGDCKDAFRARKDAKSPIPFAGGAQAAYANSELNEKKSTG